MVIETDVIEKINSQTEKKFVLLEISGGLEFVQSQGTWKFYATARKCRIPSTFNIYVAKMMIGSTVLGEIVRTECTSYEYIFPRTSVIIKLSHYFAYQPEGGMELVGGTIRYWMIESQAQKQRQTLLAIRQYKSASLSLRIKVKS